MRNEFLAFEELKRGRMYVDGEEEEEEGDGRARGTRCGHESAENSLVNNLIRRIYLFPAGMRAPDPA